MKNNNQGLLMLEDIPIEDQQSTETGQEVAAACCIRRNQHNIYRRAFSESKLLEILPVNLEEGCTYHCISGGDIDSLSFLKHIVRFQNLKYCLFSTWCMADDDIKQFGSWLKTGKIECLDAYCGEIFPGSYAQQHRLLTELINTYGGRVCIFRNHSKVYAGIGDKFAFAITSSANINTNPRTENTTISIGIDVFDFYKTFFDGIKSFRRDYDEWKPYDATDDCHLLRG